MTLEEKAYIAGFLDGDGSIIAQIVRRKDYKLHFQIRTSVVFYQKASHQKHLLWLKEQLGCGYIRIRNDGMSEYTIVGFREVNDVLKLLHPFLRLKSELARDVLSIIEMHPEQRKLSIDRLLEICELVDKTAAFNYSKRRTISVSTVKVELGKVQFPVETGVQQSYEQR